jgi:hypothetical protein
VHGRRRRAGQPVRVGDAGLDCVAGGGICPR